MFKILTTIIPLILAVCISEAQSLKSSAKAPIIPASVMNKANEKLLDNKELSVSILNSDKAHSSSENEEELQTMEVLLDDAKKKLQKERSFQAMPVINNYEKIELFTKESNAVDKSSSLRDMPLTEEERNLLMIGKNTSMVIEQPYDADQDSVYVLIDTEPSFVGGKGALNRFLSSKLMYPQQPIKNVSGNVYVRFLVTKTGKIEKVHIAKGLSDAAYNNEAIKAIKQMPNWKPATVAGRPVSSYCIFPITFSAN
jgi:protein TonB